MEYLAELRYILFHPTDGFDNMKYKKTGSIKLSFLVVVLWFIASVMERQYTSFRFNPNNVNQTNIFFILIATLVLFFFFTIANWSVCTLFDGEGTYREIFVTTGYALVPYVISIYITTILSYFVSVNEQVFLQFITIAGVVYSLYLLFIGMMQIHQYNFIRMLVAIVVSVIGIFMLLFLCFLVIVLFQQMFSFLKSLLEESLMRNMV